MAIYKLDPATGIETVSGAISRHRLPDGSVEAWIMTKKGRMYHRVYRRTKPLSENEAIHRALFSFYDEKEILFLLHHRKKQGAIIYHPELP